MPKTTDQLNELLTRSAGGLSFEPISKEYNSFKVILDRRTIQYILDYHNKDNRKVSRTQVNRIYRSIITDGWLLDGDPIRFNTDGNLTEGQHRLLAMLKCSPDMTFEVIIVVGVSPDCFTKGAQSKPRRAIDEIQRKYPEANPSVVSALADLLKRRKGYRLSINNAIHQYDVWNKDVESALNESGSFPLFMQKFANQTKTVIGWITLCKRYSRLDDCLTFLELVEGRLEETDERLDAVIADDFVNYWNGNAIDLTNEMRYTTLYSMLCKATDLIVMRDDGSTPFNPTIKDLSHTEMAKEGVYRRFLA